jgi:[ribosomal protein S5]-alanine N-acetyltransferase
LSTDQGGFLLPAEVRTDRLRLRQWRDRDLNAYARMVADPLYARFLTDGALLDRSGAWRQMALVAGHWSLRGYGQWAVELVDTGEFVGRVGPWFPEGWPGVELGWGIEPQARGKGYATEAAREALRLTWSLSTDRVISIVHEENVASIAVTNKLGGALVGTHAGPLLLFEYARPVAVPETKV